MQPSLERRGHNWQVAEDARAYVERVDREDRRAEGLALLPGLLRRAPDEPVRVLDVGTGQGLLAARLLDAFPAAVAVGLDGSEPMRQIAAERMAAYGDRFRFVLGDFVSGELAAAARGPFDVAVSSRAIHHVPSDGKKRLYAAIYNALAPGGAFFNLDGARPAEDELRGIYRAAGGRPPRSRPDEERARLSGHYFETLDEHLGFLRAAGFRLVDCFWKRLDLVLIGGYK
jgi:tRNA (cmo5U34)-methyltransferase